MVEDPTPYLQGGGYLNDAGHELYAKSIYSIIRSAVNSGAKYKETQTSPIYADAEKFDDFLYVPASRFNRSGNQYTMDTSFRGIIAFDFAIPPGENSFDIYVDRVKTASYTVTNTISVPVEHIELVSDEINASRRIGVIFRSDELAENFRGMCVSTTG
jgi:hypothetical protein